MKVMKKRKYFENEKNIKDGKGVKNSSQEFSDFLSIKMTLQGAHYSRQLRLKLIEVQMSLSYLIPIGIPT